MSRYDISRVGLPITNATVSEEFRAIVAKLKHNKNWVGIMVSDDEKNAPAGYRVLRDIGVDYKIFNVWESNRDPAKATISLLSQLKRLHSELLFERAVLFTPGSPYIDDAISKVLLSAYDDIEVIDTKGAPQIAAEFIEEMTGLQTEIRNYYDDFVLMHNHHIDRSKATIFSCLQNIYNVSLCDVVTKLKPDRIIAVNVGECIIAKEYTYCNIIDSCDELAKSETSYTFGFIFDK
jgi:hypothetical protein